MTQKKSGDGSLPVLNFVQCCALDEPILVWGVSLVMTIELNPLF
jgi:hypothetical protein